MDGFDAERLEELEELFEQFLQEHDCNTFETLTLSIQKLCKLAVMSEISAPQLMNTILQSYAAAGGSVNATPVVSADPDVVH